MALMSSPSKLSGTAESDFHSELTSLPLKTTGIKRVTVL